jgi:phosphoglycolate phosphatase-like HAD superfamily hydrolase
MAPPALAVDLAVLGDVEPLWRAWLADASRRARVELDPAHLDAQLANWRSLLERFAEEHAPVHLRRDSATAAALRRLHAERTRIGVFTDLPVELAVVALAHLGASRRVETVGSLEEVRGALGDGVRIVRTRDDLAALAV